MSSSSSRDTRVYVGNLPPDIRTRDVEDLFYKYGDITYIDLKTRRGPPFAFVEFSDPRYVFHVLLMTNNNNDHFLLLIGMQKMLFFHATDSIMMVID